MQYRKLCIQEIMRLSEEAIGVRTYIQSESAKSKLRESASEPRVLNLTNEIVDEIRVETKD